jgi:hypothetical protein
MRLRRTVGARLMAVQGCAALLLVVFFIVDAPLSQPLIGHVIALAGALWIASTILRAREEQA